MLQHNGAESLYSLIANDDDGRACADLPPGACDQVPGNFLLVLFSQVLTNLGDLLTSPKIVLAWLLGAVGAPPALTALLVPVREAFSMIPQLALGAWMRGRAIRKTFWVLGSVGQGLCVALMALVIWRYQGLQAGLGVLGALLLFSLSRGLCSVAMKDVMGKTIPRERRGRLAGLATAAAGIMTALLSLWLFRAQGELGKMFYLGLLIVAAALWGNAAVLFARVQEHPGENEGAENALARVRANAGLLWRDKALRHFVISRGLLMSSALAPPFLVMLLQGAGGSGRHLGALLLAASLASSLAGGFWGLMADRSSRQVMIAGGVIASLCCLLVAALVALDVQAVKGVWLMPLLYFVLTIGYAGVRIGRKTYLVNMASGDRRTDYVSVSNTAIGLLMLLAGAGCAALADVSPLLTVLVLGLIGLAGVVSSWRLPETE